MPIFKTPFPVVLDISVLYASVTVTAGDGARDTDSTTVEITPENPSNAKDVAEAKSIRVDASGTSVTITAPPPGFFSFHNRGTARVRVVCPRNSSVDAYNRKGPIKLMGHMGRVGVDSGNGRLELDYAAEANLRTGNGDIKVGECTGSLDAHTSSGGLDVRRAHGTATIHSNSGTIRVDSVAQDLRATTNNGKITVNDARAKVDVSTNNGEIMLARTRADVAAKTLNGRVTVRVVRGVRANVDAHTHSGSVKNSLGDGDGGDGDGDAGEVQIHLRSNSGSIVVERASEAAPAAETAGQSHASTSASGSGSGSSSAHASASASHSAPREEQDWGPVPAPDSLPPRYNQEWRYGETAPPGEAPAPAK